MTLDAPPVLEVDPRIELIAAVEALAVGNPCAHCEKTAYFDRLVKSLDRDHPACRLFARMTAQDWRNRHPSLIMLDLGAPPELKITGNADHYARQDSSDALSHFLPALRDFAAKGFTKAFAKEKGFFASFLAPVRPDFESMDYRTELRRYLGMPAPDRYHFIFSPLYHGRLMHNLLYHRKGGAVDIYSISGHYGVSGGLPQPSFNAREMIYQAWHEVLHTVIDAMTQAHRRELEPCSGLYALMKGRAINQYRGPQGWLHIVDEHVIRAMTSRLMAASFGEAAGMAKLQHEKGEGFVLVELVHQALLEYESSRERFPAFSGFYPNIVQVFVRARARGDRRRDAPQ